MLLYISILISLSLLYALVIALYIQAWKTLPTYRVPPTGYIAQTRISILIPARNEADHILECLDAILSQNYPSNLFEILVIDDHSEDNTATLIQSRMNQGCAIQLISLATYCVEGESYSYKKKAIETALNYAKGELIVTTDADCIPPPNWLNYIAHYYEQSGKVFIAAPVNFYGEQNVFQAFQVLDFMGMMLVTGAGIHWRFANMCNGANLAYRKSVFYEVGGFGGIDHLASGDDVLLLQKVAKKYPNRIGFIKSPDVAVRTHPQRKLAGFVQQRIRWATKSGAYEEWQMQAVLLIVWLTCLGCLTSLVSSIFLGWSMLWTCLIQLGIKAIADFFFLRIATHFFRRQDLMTYFLPALFMHVLYISIIGLMGNLVKQYRWKGRRVR